jgi:hypothetical protein
LYFEKLFWEIFACPDLGTNGAQHYVADKGIQIKPLTELSKRHALVRQIVRISVFVIFHYILNHQFTNLFAVLGHEELKLHRLSPTLLLRYCRQQFAFSSDSLS